MITNNKTGWNKDSCNSAQFVELKLEEPIGF